MRWSPPLVVSQTKKDPESSSESDGLAMKHGGKQWQTSTEQSPKMAGRLDIVLWLPQAVLPHPHGETLILAHINPSTWDNFTICCIAQSSLHVGQSLRHLIAYKVSITDSTCFVCDKYTYLGLAFGSPGLPDVIHCPRWNIGRGSNLSHCPRGIRVKAC